MRYLVIDSDRRVEAREWVAEQEALLDKERADAIDREHRILAINTWTLIVAIIGVLVGIVAIVVTLRH